MQINLQAKNLELTEEIKDYVLKRVTNLGKFLTKINKRGGEVNVNFEVSRTTNHHRTGDVFSATCSINADGEKFYLSEEREDVYAAIDAVKENLYREISKSKNRKDRLFYRGARRAKEIMKGLASYRPWRK